MIWVSLSQINIVLYPSFQTRSVILNFSSQDLIVNTPFKLLHISLWIGYENLVLNQDNKLYLMSLSILTTCLLDNVWIP